MISQELSRACRETKIRSLGRTCASFLRYRSTDPSLEPVHFPIDLRDDGHTHFSTLPTPTTNFLTPGTYLDPGFQNRQIPQCQRGYLQAVFSFFEGYSWAFVQVQGGFCRSSIRSQAFSQCMVLHCITMKMSILISSHDAHRCPRKSSNVLPRVWKNTMLALTNTMHPRA